MIVEEAEMSTQEKPRQRFTYGDYLGWPDEERWEILEGEAYAMSPAPRPEHQRIVAEVIRQIGNFLRGKPCRVYPAPFDVRFPLGDEADEEIDTVTGPDVSVICDETKLDDAGCRGAPDWVIEVLSPSTMERDIREKYHLYEKHGVREYWIVAPSDNTVIVHVLGDDGTFSPGARHGGSGRVAATVVKGLEIDLQQVFGE